jgi:Na+/H+ antiporter NhaD/arsenite permease-like protein
VSPQLGSTTDAVSQGIVAVVIVGVFLSLALEKVHRLLVVIGAVSLLWAITYLTPYRLITFEGATQALDFNVLFLLAAMMAVVGVLKTTGVFAWAVARMVNRANGDSYLVLVLITWFTAALSAFCDNVTTVIFVTPMVLEIAPALGIAPVALLLPVVMASNVGGTATLIGDPPNIMIGSGAHLTFLDFIENLTAPVAVMTLLLPRVGARYFRGDIRRPGTRATAAAASPQMPVPAITDPLLLKWALAISALIFVGFFTHGLTGMPTAVPATIGAGALLVVQDVLYLRTHRPTSDERVHGLIGVIEREIEWPTLSFFGFLFIAVGAAVQTGLIDTLARGLSEGIRGGAALLGLEAAGTLLFAALLVVWVSGVLSAIIDNIPFVAVMIPILLRLAGELPGDATVLWWALALGACLGGNGTAVGASANVTVIGLAERAGVRITFKEFTRFGAVVTVGTLILSSAFLATRVFLGAGRALLAWCALFVVLALAERVAVRAQTAAVLRAPPASPLPPPGG